MPELHGVLDDDPIQRDPQTEAEFEEIAAKRYAQRCLAAREVAAIERDRRRHDAAVTAGRAIADECRYGDLIEVELGNPAPTRCEYHGHDSAGVRVAVADHTYSNRWVVYGPRIPFHRVLRRVGWNTGNKPRHRSDQGETPGLFVSGGAA